MEILVVLAVMVVAVMVIAGPLRRRRQPAEESAPAAQLAELEAAKEAKLREIREAELDHRLGKLSRDDWRALDATLRQEAIVILRRLDELQPPEDVPQS
jgi:Tfp pilus assembly protein PilN